MLDRRLQVQLLRLLQEYPAVALLGSRQVGKTTLALKIAETYPSIYLDLESAGTSLGPMRTSGTRCTIGLSSVARAEK